MNEVCYLYQVEKYPGLPHSTENREVKFRYQRKKTKIGASVKK